MRRWPILFLLCLLSGASWAQYAPLAIAWQAPQNTDTTNFNNFVNNILPHLSGIGGSSSDATGNNLGNVYWSAIDNCSHTAPCATEADYNWAAIDNQLIAYINSHPGGGILTFANGCFGGKSCVIILRIAPQQDSGTGVTKTPDYAMSHIYALSLGVPDQDVSFALAWPGAVSGSVWPGTVPCTNITTANDACIMSATGGCTAYGAAVCGTPVGPPSGTQNLSGFPVVYEVPIVTAYKKFLTALFLHYSPGGSGNGPTIAPYLKLGYIPIGLAAGAENNPGNVGTGDAGGGLLTHPFWPCPRGLAACPAAYTKCGYVTNWPGVAQNGITNCPGGGSADGDGYVTMMDKFFATLNTHGIKISQSTHGGPPGNSNTFNAVPIAFYSDAEAILTSIYGQPSGNFAGLGFGMQSVRLADIASNASVQPCTQNWCTDFQKFSAPVYHLETINDGGATPHAAEFRIGTISCVSTLCTVPCLGSIGNSCEVFGNGTTILITGNSNPNYNGFQVITCGGSCGAGTIQFTSSSTAGGSGGQLWSPSYLPMILPFATQHRSSSAEMWECDLDYAFGTTTSNIACGGDPGPDTSWQTAITNFENGVPTGTATVLGTVQSVGTIVLE